MQTLLDDVYPDEITCQQAADVWIEEELARQNRDT